MSSLLTGETASNNYNVPKIFGGENANREASAQTTRNYEPPTKIFSRPVLKTRNVPNMIRMMEWDPVNFKMNWVERQFGTKPEFYWE